MENSKIEKLINQKMKEYKDYNISKDVLEEIYNSLDCQDENLVTTGQKFDRKIEKYIIEEIRKENLDYQIIVIKKFSYLKFMIQKNIKYNIITQDELNNIYEKSIDLVVESYKEDDMLSVNILNEMKRLIRVTAIRKSKGKNDKKDIFHNLSFMKEYIELFKFSKFNLANLAKCEFYKVDDLLDGKILKNDMELMKLYDFFKVKNYEELKKMIEERIEERKSKPNNSKNNKCVDIKNKNTKKDSNIDINQLTNDEIIDLLKEYMKVTQITQKSLANKLGIYQSNFSIYLLKKRKMPKELLEKILKYFKAENISKLKENIEKQINEYKVTTKNQLTINSHESDSNDDKLKLSPNKQKTLIVNDRTTSQNLREKQVSEKIIEQNKIMVDNSKQDDKCEEKTDSNLKSLISSQEVLDNDDMISLYILTNNKNELANKLGVSVAFLDEYLKYTVLGNNNINFKMDSGYKKMEEQLLFHQGKSPFYENCLKFINRELLFSIVKPDTLIKEDYVIFMLLFGGFNGRCYSIEIISDLIGVDKSYVANIFKMSLEEYKKAFNSLSNDLYLMVMKNVETE